MAYRLRRKESAADGFCRIAREETAASVSLLADRGNNIANRIHDARRHIKRLRALLHLVRGSMDPAQFAAENGAMRDAGRRLAGARDAVVALCTLEALSRRYSFEPAPALRARLKERARQTKRGISAAQLARIAAVARRSGNRIAEAPLSKDGWPLVKCGLSRSLRAARKSRDAARRNPSDAVLHEWRKRMKRLGFQLDLIRNLLPKPEKRRAKLLAQASALLGEVHDLSVLSASLQNRESEISADAEAISEFMAKRRDALLRRVVKHSKVIFGDSSKVILRKVHQAWKRWRKEK